jgi:A/G-specific adenine glycosylase
VARSRLTLWLLHAVDEQGRVWLAPRPASGIWARLHCLPEYGTREQLLQDLPAPARAAAVFHPPFSHVLTHRDLDIHVVSANLPASERCAAEGRWHTSVSWPALGLPAPVRRFLQASDTGTGF